MKTKGETLTENFPRVHPVRTPEEWAQVRAFNGEAQIPMRPSHYILRDEVLSGVAVQGHPFTYFRGNEKLLKARDVFVVCNVFENLTAAVGIGHAVAYVDNDCPFAHHMPRLGYVAAPGKLYWKEL